MRIGIDGRELCGHATGVGRYLGGLLRAWTATDAAGRHELVVYAPAVPDLGPDAGRIATRVVGGGAGTWWEQVRLPPVAARDELDVFFAPAYTAPLTLGVPLVLALHDLSFVAHPEWFRLREGIRRRAIARAAARRARRIVTISEFSRSEIVERLGVPAARIAVIPPGIDRPITDAGAGAGPRVLFVGSIFNRRHVPDLIRGVAFLARRRPEVSLAIVGDNRSYPHESIDRLIGDLGLEYAARWHAYVPDEELRSLYGGARAFAFLSEYEGLGLTPLEALAAGIPPLVADTAVARESCGEAALYVDPADTRAIAGALERLLFDEPTRARLLAAAPAVLARYDWSRAAADTLALLEAAAHV